MLESGVGHIPEDRHRYGLVLDFTLAENAALHDFRYRPDSRFGWLFPRVLTARTQRLIRSSTYAEAIRRPRQGRSPAEISRSSSSRARWTATRAYSSRHSPREGLDVGAIEYLHRRLVEERDRGRAILLISLELEEVLSLSDRILVMYEGEIVARARVRRQRGGDRDRDARRRTRGGGVSESTPGPPYFQTPPPVDPSDPPAPEDGEPTTVAGRYYVVQKLGGIVPAVLTGILAFLMGGIVIAISGHNPLSAYAGILDGAGVNWFWDHFGNTSVLDLSTFNLTQTLLRTTTFIFTGLAVAFAFRCGLFNIGGQGQYTMGIVVGIWVGAYWGNSFRTGFTSLSASRSPPWPAPSGRVSQDSSRRSPEPTR